MHCREPAGGGEGKWILSDVSDVSDVAGRENAALDDETLIRRTAGGDRDAFGALVERYHGMILIVAERILRNRDDAMEISQDVLALAYAQIHTLKRADRLKAWLARITRNCALALLRRRRHVWVEFHCGQATTVAGRIDQLANFPQYIASAAAGAQQNELKSWKRLST